MSEANRLSQLSTGLPLSEWQVSQLRLTAFPDVQSEFDSSSWWLDVVGDLPDTRMDEPRVGKHREHSTLEDKELTLAIESGRIDWLLGVPEQGALIDGIPTIGSLPEVHEAFCEYVFRWFGIDNLPPVTRLAFGAIVLYPVDDLERGYRTLVLYLPVELDPVGSSDFLYQINRPRNSGTGVPELRINRLSKWSVMHSTRVTLDSSGVTTKAGSRHFACRLQLDINTVPDFPEVLPRKQLPQIFRELIDLGEEIILRGDIP